MAADPSRISSAKHEFVLVSGDGSRYRDLKEMVEFLNAELVILDRLADWRPRIGASQLSAVFIGDDVGARERERVISSAREIDENASIVLISRSPGAKAETAGPTSSVAHDLELKYPASLPEVDIVLTEIRALHRHGSPAETCPFESNQLTGNSRQIQEIDLLINRVSPTDSTVLITGESGTGKEVIARRIHLSSGRKGKFVAINCGAIPDHLLESELFGHERGAFSGADRARTGRFELAEGGTLFLDEIGDMPKSLQVKLLRVLQERTVERVGGAVSIPIDIRVIAATHRDLQQRIDEGLFREDLYYRLNVFPIEIPPLRERIDDIEPLLDEFVGRMRRAHGVQLAFADDAIKCLKAYPWPGNVREFSNLIERLTVIAGQHVIARSDLPPPIGESGANASARDPTTLAVLPESGLNLKDYLSSVESDAIREALKQSQGVVQGAADLLGMSRTTLVEKIKRYGIVT